MIYQLLKELEERRGGTREETMRLVGSNYNKTNTRCWCLWS